MATRTAERVEFLSDIITTAIEGGIGYWSVCSHYQYIGSDGETKVCVRGDDPADRDDAYAVIQEEDDFGIGDPLIIDIDTIAKGIGLIVRGEVGIRSDLLDALKLGNAENDAGEIDADIADCIVQAGLFGGLVYG